MLKIKPFIKWSNDIELFSDELISLFPNNYSIYIEPLIGNGSIFLIEQPRFAIINDSNVELIDTYRFLNSNSKHFFKKMFSTNKNYSIEKKFTYLLKLESNYKNSDNKEDFFNRIRDWNLEDIILEKKVARFIFLNKTWLNGSYYLNSKTNKQLISNDEDFNIFSLENIELINSYFHNFRIEIFNKNYLDIIDIAKKDDFVFINFSSYKKNKFIPYSDSLLKLNKENQTEVLKKLRELDKRGTKWMICAYPNTLIKKNYKEYKFKTLKIKKNIDSNLGKNNLNLELLVYYNY